MRFLKILAAILFVTLIGLMGAAYFMSEPRPEGTSGEEADALARKMEAAVHKEAWDQTGAVRWSFFEEHHYVWDRTRDMVEVRWGDTRALLRTGDQSGRVWGKDGEVTGADAEAALQTAYRFWINDSFWLNPVTKLFDPGTNRAIVTEENGDKALLLSYESGGVTPGDAYLWNVDPDGLPTRWRMWVKIIPIGGVAVTWEGWKELSTGALIATEHEGGGRVLTFITDVEGAKDLEALGVDDDLFAPLIQGG